MKKLVLMFVAIAAISFASCGNKTAQAEGGDSIQNDSVSMNDSLNNDSMSSDSLNNDSVK